jgi:hypothetical protein
MDYLMRALADPGPGYVTWTSTTADYDGYEAPETIQAGTAVAISWPNQMEYITTPGKLGITGKLAINQATRGVNHLSYKPALL